VPMSITGKMSHAPSALALPAAYVGHDAIE
jgi:hypothetical protein